MDLPEQFGSWEGVHDQLHVWAADGTRAKVFTALLAQADAEGDPEWAVAVDSTIERAHQHAAGAVVGARPASRPTMPSDGPTANCPPRFTSPPTAAAGRSHAPSCPGRLVTHPHSSGSWPGSAARGPRPVGRPRTTPAAVLADEAYSSRAIHRHLRRRGIRAMIPVIRRKRPDAVRSAGSSRSRTAAWRPVRRNGRPAARCAVCSYLERKPSTRLEGQARSLRESSSVVRPVVAAFTSRRLPGRASPWCGSLRESAVSAGFAVGAARRTASGTAGAPRGR